MQALGKRVAIPSSVSGAATARPRRGALKTSSRVFLLKAYRMADIVIAIAALLCAFIITNLNQMPSELEEFLALRVTVKNLLLLGIFVFIWSSVCSRSGLYDSPRLNRVVILRIVIACACGSFFALLFPLTSRSGAFRLSAVLWLWPISSSLSFLARFLLSPLAGESDLGRHEPKQVVIVGSGARALNLYHEICRKGRDEYQLLGFVDSENSHPIAREIQSRTLGDLDHLENILVNHVVDEVLITLPVKSCYTQIQNTLQICEHVGVESKFLSALFPPSLARPSNEQLENSLVLSVKLVTDDYRLMVKRAFDGAAALLGLIILSPVMLLIAACIKLTSAGPIIFSQQRYGRHKRRFKMYKFRTKVTDAEALQQALEERNEAAGPVFKIREDPRITRVGAFLRRTSLDELPQLFNVLRGEMSLVGPRPLPLRDVSRFSESWLLRRFCVVPGITCLWQINGRSNTSFDRWAEQDLKYIDEWSLTLDLKILVRTIPAVLRGHGAV
jgi:exopolysaccharide biosynthesis polyprenyl glycosylphosphotransferase